MPKQTKSSNNTALKGFALTLVILILAVCVMAAMTEGFSNWNPYGWFDKPAEEQQSDGDGEEDSVPIDTTITNSEHVMLAMSAAVTAAEGTREAKLAMMHRVMVTATLLTVVPISAGMQMLKKRIMATVLETKLVSTRQRK